MQDEHKQLGEFGAIPGAPSGPPKEGQASAGKAATLEIHPAAEIFPPMSDSEYAALLADMRVNGQTHPIITWKGMVIDGRNRLRACRELGIEPKVQEWDGKGSLFAFILSANLVRRHLDESQRAMVAAKLKPVFEDQAKKRMLAGKELDPSFIRSKGPSAAEAGTVMNVSRSGVERACRVLKDGVPDLVDGVSKGTIKVAIAAELARYSKEEQMKILAKGPAAIREAASFWKKQEQKRAQASVPYQQHEYFLLGSNHVHKESDHYNMEVDEEFRDQIASILDDEHDENLMKAIKRGLLIVLKKE
jgi:hypothetical protein